MERECDILSFSASWPSTRRTSPTIGICAFIFLPISAGSTSMWITLAFSAICPGSADRAVAHARPQRMREVGVVDGAVGRPDARRSQHAEVGERMVR